MWNPFDRKHHKNNRIYLDYASATPVLPEAADAVRDAERTFGNPGSIHAEGVAAARRLQDSREKIAHELGSKAREIIFTSGGTEANNLGILGFARAIQKSDFGKKEQRSVLGSERHRSVLGSTQGPTTVPSLPLSQTHWLVSSIEHPSVLEAFGEIERLGGKVDFVDPDSNGIIRPEAVARALRPETVFVSIGWANGEIGTIQPLARIARIVREHEEAHRSTVILHCDAGQAPLYRAAHVHSLGVDMLTLDSGKLYGPRGIGALYLNDRVKLAGIILGGKQERGLRAGTENVALAAGFAAAFAIIAAERANESKRLQELRHSFARELRTRIPGVILNGDKDASLPHILNISIPDINSEYLTLALDHAGIAISTKSACREGEEQRSHVVEALALAAEASAKEAQANEWRSKNTLRFSFGRETSEADIRMALETLSKLLQKHPKA
jgi:cysteine desulfurase